MKGILADINSSESWFISVASGCPTPLAVLVRSRHFHRNFESLGLQLDAPDAVIWRTCQEQALVLITANRMPTARTRWRWSSGPRTSR